MNIGKRIEERKQKIEQDREAGVLNARQASRQRKYLRNFEAGVSEGRISPKEARRLLRGTSLWRRILGKK